jgi:hypothetical protein
MILIPHFAAHSMNATVLRNKKAAGAFISSASSY